MYLLKGATIDEQPEFVQTRYWGEKAGLIPLWLDMRKEHPSALVCFTSAFVCFAALCLAPHPKRRYGGQPGDDRLNEPCSVVLPTFGRPE